MERISRVRLRGSDASNRAAGARDAGPRDLDYVRLGGIEVGWCDANLLVLDIVHHVRRPQKRVSEEDRIVAGPLDPPRAGRLFVRKRRCWGGVYQGSHEFCYAYLDHRPLWSTKGK